MKTVRVTGIYPIVLLSLFFPVFPLFADDTEHREFSVFIDGKEAGASRVTLVQKNDGMTYMSAILDVKFRHLLIAEYAIKIETQEWWKEGRLIGMKTKTVDNGKKTEVAVAPDGDQLRLTINGMNRVIRPDIWTNSFWKLADARFHNKQVPILEVDSGKDFVSDLKYIETQQLKVGNQLQDCYRFRITSSIGPIDLWFDRYHRLVRQEFMESGHKTVVQLVNIRR